MATHCLNLECKSNNILDNHTHCKKRGRKEEGKSFDLKKCKKAKLKDYHPGSALAEEFFGDRYRG